MSGAVGSNCGLQAWAKARTRANAGSGSGLRSVLLAAIGAFGLTMAASANVELSLHQVSAPDEVGDTVEVQLIARSDTGSNETMAAASVIITWDVATLDLLGNHTSGAVNLLTSSFPADPFGLNTDLHDGDAIYVAFAPLGNPVVIPPEGALITTYVFEALAVTPGTLVDIPATFGGAVTEVFDGEIAGLVITGALFGGQVEIVDSCPPDLDHNGDVGFGDLIILLASWGPCAPGDCPADLDGNNDVGFGDLIILLDAWGACPG